LEYDLLTRTHYQLDDVGGALSWSSLYSFIKYLPGDSALAQDLEKPSAIWDSRIKTNAILADIYDLLQILIANLSGKKQNITPYPRPGREENTKRKFGQGAMPYNELREWIRGRQHG
jgi:hypothetical protein